MNRTWWQPFLAVAIVAGVVAAVPAAGAPLAAPKPPVGVVSITGRQVSDRRVDEGPPGRGIGDVEILWQSLYNQRITQRPIGHAQVICTILTTQSRSCSGTYFLPKGKMMVAGVIGSRLLYEVAVVGGTGVYAGARGSLLVTQASADPPRDILVFQLIA